MKPLQIRILPLSVRGGLSVDLHEVPRVPFGGGVGHRPFTAVNYYVRKKCCVNNLFGGVVQYDKNLPTSKSSRVFNIDESHFH